MGFSNITQNSKNTSAVVINEVKFIDESIWKVVSALQGYPDNDVDNNFAIYIADQLRRMPPELLEKAKRGIKDIFLKYQQEEADDFDEYGYDDDTDMEESDLD